MTQIPLKLESRCFNQYLSSRTTDAQRGNSLHCTAKNSIQNFQVRPKLFLSATSPRFFRYLYAFIGCPQSVVQLVVRWKTLRPTFLLILKIFALSLKVLQFCNFTLGCTSKGNNQKLLLNTCSFFLLSLPLINRLQIKHIASCTWDKLVMKLYLNVSPFLTFPACF